MTQQFLVTKVETETDANNNTTVHLFGRDADSKRIHKTVEGFEHYFYVATSEVLGNESAFVGSNGIAGIDHDTERDPFTFGTVPESVSRVTVEDAENDVRTAKDLFTTTWEADVSPRNRYRIESGLKAWATFSPETERVDPIESPVEIDPQPRVLTLDIEVDDRGGFPDPGEKRITSIVAHDSYDDEFIGFIDGDNRDIAEMFPNGKPEEVDALHVEPTEKQMLVNLACWIGEHDPDVLTAWNVDFDAPYLLARMETLGVDPSRMSMIGIAGLDYRGDAKIGGVSVYDLLDMYKKNMWGELRSYSLDYVAGEELGASKIHHERGFFEMFEADPEQLINYNSRDTRLAVGINDTAGVIEFRDSLRKQIGVDFSDTVNNYQFIEMMARRKIRERDEVAPTADPDGGEKFEGGHVMDAFSGVANNVMGIDVESLYPWTMYMLNASPDTKIDEERAIAENIPYSKAPNGVCFRLDRDGLFKSLVKDALDLKEGFRTLKNEADPGSVEEALYAVKYQVSKTITNSIYGVIGWTQFFLYDRETAEAVTLAGQAVVKASGEYVDKHTEADVIYGDTDSNYIRFPSDWEQERCVNEALRICDELEAEVYPPLAEEMHILTENCEWRIDPEMFASRFLQWSRKKKYAYKATWKEGMEPDAVMDNPEVVIKGSAAKRSDAARLTRDTDKAVVTAILDDRVDDVSGIIYEAATDLDPDNPNWNRIGIPGGIGKGFSEYEKPTAHVEAAMNANELCGTEFEKGSKPMRVYLRPMYFDEIGEKIDRIAYESADDLRPVEDRLVVDAARMTETLLTKPLEGITDAVDVDISAAVSGQDQTAIGKFV